MSKPGLTLENIKQTSPKLNPGKVFRASDVLTEDEQRQVRLNRASGRTRRRKFDDIDAMMAEIIARFGYDTYRAYNAGEIEPEKMVRFLNAERAREASSNLKLYGIIMAMVGALVKRTKGQPAPKGPKIAQKIFNSEQKTAKGDD